VSQATSRVAPTVGRVLDEVAVGATEGGAQRVAVVVIPDHGIDRHRQRREELGGALVLRRCAVLGDVAADNGGLGRGAERRDRLDGYGQGPRGLPVARPTCT
jgi:hypothetical protein